MRDALPKLLPCAARVFPARLSVALRVAARLVVVWTVVTAGLPGGRVLVAAAVVCAGYDLLLGRWLARGGQRLGVRLVADAVDAAAWSVALHGSADLTAVVACPLAAQWALWRGGRAALVPVVVGAAVVAAGLADGGRWQPMGLVWPVAGAVCGAVARAALLGRLRWQEDAARIAREAAAGQAELAGRAEVALGADSVVDLLARTAPLVAAAEERPRPSPFAPFKARLARELAARAAYLQVTLREWERRHNSRDPDLATDVVLRLPPGAGTLLLSARQVAALHAALDGMALRGEVRVRVVRAAGPGRAQLLGVAGREVALPEDPRPRLGRLHPVAVLFVFGAVVSVQHALPAFDGSPWYAMAPVGACALAAAWWCQRRAAAGADLPPGLVLAVALLIATADSVVSSTVYDRAAYPGARYGFLGPLDWVAPGLVFFARDLSLAGRVAAVAGLGGAVGAGAVLGPGQLTWEGMLGTLPWLAAALVALTGLRPALEADARALAARQDGAHERAVAEGLRRGRRQVVEPTREALDELAARFARVAARLPGPVAAEVARRLAEARARLSAVGV